MGIFSFLLGGLGYSLIQEWDAVGKRRSDEIDSKIRREAGLLKLATQRTSEEKEQDRLFFSTCKIKDLYEGIEDDMQFILEKEWSQGMECCSASDSRWKTELMELWLSKRGKLDWYTYFYVTYPFQERKCRVIERNLREYYFQYENKFLFKTLGFNRGIADCIAPAQCLNPIFAADFYPSRLPLRPEKCNRQHHDNKWLMCMGESEPNNK